jgi:SAM-dependent methyltransferase
MRLGTIKEQVYLVAGDVQHLPFKEGVFDLVGSSHVFEHLREPKEAIGSISSTLKSGGIFISTQSNILNPLIFLAKIFPEKVFLKIPGNPGHPVYYRMNSFGKLKNTLIKNKIEIISLQYHAVKNWYEIYLKNSRHLLFDLIILAYSVFETFIMKISNIFSSNITFVGRKK